MREILDEYGGAVLGVIACLELIGLVAEIMLFGNNPGTLGHFIDTITSGYL